MKVIAFSDIHGQHNEMLTRWFVNNPADLLIFAGDLQANQTTDNGIEFIDWLHELPYFNKIMVFGNHDGHYMDMINHVAKNNYNDIVILIDEAIEINGVKIFGSPHSVEYGSWWFMKKDNELDVIWKKIPNDTDILVTHGPPYGVLDCTVNNVSAGSKSLIKRITELKNLQYHIFGHIHEGYGKKKISNTTFMNVSLANEYYRLVNAPTIFNCIDTDYNIGE